MEHWFLAEDKANGTSEGMQQMHLTEPNGRKHTFRVLVNQTVEPTECVAVTGECFSLGNWMPSRVLQLQRENDTNIWSREVSVPDDKDTQYRYLVCTIDPITENIHIRRWETHLVPRQIPAYTHDHNLAVNKTAVPQDGSASTSARMPPGNHIDTFGDIAGAEKIDRGWLTTETVLQFKFIRNPFVLKQKLKHRLLYVKLTPMNLRMNDASHAHTAGHDDSLSSDTRENGSTEQPVYAFAEVATLKSASSVFETQSQFGRPYLADDIMLFNVSVGDPENVAYLIDLYTYSSRVSPDDDEPPYHLGYHYILPNLLRKSDGRLEIPITCATKHRPLGTMNIDYVKITPLKSSIQLTMKQTYTRYWNKRLRGLEVGHRGAGTSFKTTSTDTIRENTIASLKRAAEHGADMVEFDVQLSKDLVPVIYHDLVVYVSLKKKKSLDENDMLELPTSELTLEQLKHLKVYHRVEGVTRQPKFFDEDLDEHQPFPTLADTLDAIDESVGFNVEIKWDIELLDGRLETDRAYRNKNLYIDCILDVILNSAGNRRIIFSCFDPDVCTMLRIKQNLYPVMFLSQGVTERYAKYYDPRCDTIENAVFHACTNELLGIVAHTEDLLRDASQINLATDLGLIMFCWGDDNNSQETIKYLKTLGLHGIIYDKMDKLTTKTDKRSIFYVEGKESQKDILRLRHLEASKTHENGSSSFASSANDSSSSTLNGSDVSNSRLTPAIEQSAFGSELRMQTLIESNTNN